MTTVQRGMRFSLGMVLGLLLLAIWLATAAGYVVLFIALWQSNIDYFKGIMISALMLASALYTFPPLTRWMWSVVMRTSQS